MEKAHYHLPGLFEFFELYNVFLPLFYENREWFYDWCDIGSIYGAPADCLWGGGRVGFGEADEDDVLRLMKKYQISARLTFSNSLVSNEHLSDGMCNRLCKKFSGQNDYRNGKFANPNSETIAKNGVIVYSDMLLDYIKDKYPELYFVSTTTKVITDTDLAKKELNRDDFNYVVLDFRLNKKMDWLYKLSKEEKAKVEFLCNECCSFGCTDRKDCYENVSKKSLGLECEEHVCRSKDAGDGYVFSRAMKNPAFISVDDIKNIYLPMGFTNFKIEGRSLGSALILEFLLYYMTKPEYQLNVREAIYLDHSLDLF